MSPFKPQLDKPKDGFGRFQERVPYGLFVPDVRDCVHTLDGSESV
jgi:hypothetical protein